MELVSPTNEGISCTAILSVYDKTGLLDLAKGLVKQNIRLLASGGTAKLIREAGFPVEYAYFPNKTDIRNLERF